jgi:two-component system, NarL family, nitrate/nitrite response regulator NarL
MKLVLCDDHALLLDALQPALARHGHEVLAVTVTPQAAVEAVRLHRPDVLLLDVSFPEDNGLRVVGAVLEASPGINVVILSAASDPQVALAAIEAGAVGFARKDRGLDGIIRTLERVLAGETVIDPDVLRALVSHTRNRQDVHDAHWLASFLTLREREVLTRIVAGQTTAEMAAGMGVARSTARTHVQAVLQKLGVHSRLQAATVMFGQPGFAPLPVTSHHG